MILRINENGSKQYESSRFLYMELVPNVGGFSLNGYCVGVTTTIEITSFCKNHSSQWQLLCVKLFLAFIQIIIINHCLFLFLTNFTKNT